MRGLFVLLLLANLALLAWLAVPLPPPGIEPERLAQQINPEQIRVLDAETAAAQAVQEQLARHHAEQENAARQAEAEVQGQRPGQAASASLPAQPGAASTTSALDTQTSSSLARAVCVELGDFSAQAAESFEPQLSRLSMTGIPQRRIVQPPPTYLVFVPPQPTEAAASRRLAQLRDKGFADSAVIREESPRRWGISVGLFSKEELAMAQLDKLHTAGITEARMGEHPLNSTRYAYRLPGVTETGASRLAAVASGYAGVTMRACK